jgi:hypothetical protein
MSEGGRAAGRVHRPQRRLARPGALDPWAHRVNVYVLDRAGNRIDRRNAQDIFVPLYDNQIPPGAADAVHFRLAVPADVVGPVTLSARLRYRKFDTVFLRHFQTDDAHNTLPVVDLAEDTVTLPVGPGDAPPAAVTPARRARTPHPSGSAGTTMASVCCARPAGVSSHRPKRPSARSSASGGPRVR